MPVVDLIKNMAKKLHEIIECENEINVDKEVAIGEVSDKKV